MLARNLFVALSGLCLAIAALTCPAAGAVAIVNGTFDLSVPSNGTGGGWTSSYIDHAGGWRSTGGNPDGYFILNDNGREPADPTIEQVVTGFAPGRVYRIEGDYRVVHINQNRQDFGVLVDGTPILELYPPSPDASSWSPFSGDFAATSASHTIAFAAERFNDTDFGVDNLTITEVPEPVTLTVIVVGVGIMAVKRRRRR